MLKEEKRKILIDLMKKMKTDESLPLKSGATNLVFGEGNVDTKVLFIGEGPGYWEDMKALPFVGRAGQLLNQTLETIGLKREDVFITNVVHHRPPENRDPSPEEMAAYQPYLDKIIEVIDPKVIVTLGRFSMGKFIPGVTITGIHGKPRTVMAVGKERAIVPMYHPAAALRSTDLKNKFMEDFKVIPKVLREVEEKEAEEKEKNKPKPEQESLI